MGKPEGKKQLGNPRCRWEDILRRICRKWDVEHGRDWPDSGEGQVAGTCKPGNEPSDSIKCWESLD